MAQAERDIAAAKKKADQKQFEKVPEKAVPSSRVRTDFVSDMILVADSRNECIRAIHPGGYVTTVAGNTHARGIEDGVGKDSTFAGPCSLALCANGAVLAVDMHSSRVRKLAPPAVIEQVRDMAAVLRRPAIEASKDVLRVAKTVADSVSTVLESTGRANRALTEVLTIALAAPLQPSPTTLSSSALRRVSTSHHPHNP